MTDELEQMSPNQRRALDKALSALETFAAIWAAEIRLGAMSARIAAVPSEAERAKRIEAMIEQGFIEGAYRHYLDHKDKCDELEAARATAEQPEPKLDKRAQVSNTRFGVGVKWSTVIGAAQRYHDFMNTPEKEGDRIENARAFLGSLMACPTAEQSRDSVIEECAMVCQRFADNMIGNTDRGAHSRSMAYSFADDIRALKSQQDAAIESKPAEQSEPAAWMYKCWDTIHLHSSQLDHFYSIDNGESYVKGVPLYTAAPQRHSELESIKSATEWLITQPNGRSYTVTDKRKVGIALSCGYDVAAIESQRSGDGS